MFTQQQQQQQHSQYRNPKLKSKGWPPGYFSSHDNLFPPPPPPLLPLREPSNDLGAKILAGLCVCAKIHRPTTGPRGRVYIWMLIPRSVPVSCSGPGEYTVHNTEENQWRDNLPLALWQITLYAWDITLTYNLLEKTVCVLEAASLPERKTKYKRLYV